MSVCVLGKKIGMTQIFDENGKQVPVTVVKVEPTYVVQKKTVESDGYSALQLGACKAKKANKPDTGHCSKAKLEPLKVLKEVRTENVEAVNVGDRVSLDMFSVGDYLNVTAENIGKGFQGVMKRHNFAGGRATHGSHFKRAPGGIGSRAGGKGAVKKVRRGRPLPGQMGNKQITVHNVQIVDLDLENELLILKGNVPGGGNNVIVLTNSFKKTPNLEWKIVEEEVPAAPVKEDVVEEVTESAEGAPREAEDTQEKTEE